MHTGKMRMGFLGRGYAPLTNQQGLLRESELLTLNVDEPPLAGRPAGYRLGDVGRYELKAAVEPRETRQGEAISVTVTLSGTGNLPTKLNLPEQDGVEWLEPRVKGNVEPQGSEVGGVRRFEYVVRLSKPGLVELGALRLPYWDPKSRSYRTAKVSLGQVSVKESTTSRAAAAAAVSENAQKLGAALTIHKELRAAAPEGKIITDSNWFWATLGLGPLSIVLTGVSLSFFKKLQRRLTRTKSDTAHLAAKAQAEAHKALKTGDSALALAEIERALFYAIEAATALKARGLLRNELEQKLAEAGLSAELAAKLSELFERCETARFTGGHTKADTDELVTAGTLALSELMRRTRPQRSTKKS